MSAERVNTKILKKQMLDALEASLGIVTVAANAVGIERKTHYRWLAADKDYAEKVAAIDSVALDFAESKLHQQIKSNNTAATIFYLKCRGKARGYVERTELTGKDGAPIEGKTAIFRLPDGTEIEI